MKETTANPNYVAPINASEFDRYIARQFGEEQTGLSPQAYGWVVEAWNAGALAERDRAAAVCDRIETAEWNAFKGRYISAHPNPEKQGSPYIEGLSDGAGMCSDAIQKG